MILLVMLTITAILGCGSDSNTSNVKDTVIIDPTVEYATLTLKAPEGFKGNIEGHSIQTNQYGSTIVENGSYRVTNKFFYLFRNKKLLKKLKIGEEHLLPTGEFMLLMNASYLPITLERGKSYQIDLANVAVMTEVRSPKITIRRSGGGSMTIKAGIREPSSRSHGILLLPSSSLSATVKTQVHIGNGTYVESAPHSIPIARAKTYHLTKKDLLVQRRFKAAKSNTPDWLQHLANTEAEGSTSLPNLKPGYVKIRGVYGKSQWIPYGEVFSIGVNRCVTIYLLGAAQKLCDESSNNQEVIDVRLSRIENMDRHNVDILLPVKSSTPYRTLIKAIEPGFGVDAVPEKYRFLRKLDYGTELQKTAQISPNETYAIELNQPVGRFRVVEPTKRVDLPIVFLAPYFNFNGSRINFNESIEVPSKAYTLSYERIPSEFEVPNQGENVIHIGQIAIKGQGGSFDVAYRKPKKSNQWFPLNTEDSYDFGSVLHLPPGNYRITTKYYDQIDEFVVQLKNVPDEQKIF